MSGWFPCLLALLLAGGCRTLQKGEEWVVVPTHEVPFGATLSRRDLRVVAMLESDVPKDVFHSASPLVGRRASARLLKGEAVLPERLVPADAPAGVRGLAPPGTTAVRILVDDPLLEAMGNAPHVDVVAVDPADPAAPACLLAQDVHLLPVDPRTVRRLRSVPMPNSLPAPVLVRPEPGDPSLGPTPVWFAADSATAARVQTHAGWTFRLALRNDIEVAVVPTPGCAPTAGEGK